MWVRRALGASAVASAFVAGTFAGCDETELTDVVYEGGTTDEALEALLAESPTMDPAKRASFDCPSDGEVLASDPPSRFCWHTGPASQGALKRAIDAPSRLTLLGEPASPPDFDLVIGTLFGGVRSAHAHGDPVEGPAYYLTFATDENPELLRVFTTALEYTPSAEAWTKLRDAGVPITAKVVWADFETNRIAPGGGPWDGVPVTITIDAQ